MISENFRPQKAAARFKSIDVMNKADRQRVIYRQVRSRTPSFLRMGKEDLSKIQNSITSADINAHATSVQKAPPKPHHPTELNHVARFPGYSYIAVIHFRIRAFPVAVLLRFFCVCKGQIRGWFQHCK